MIFAKHWVIKIFRLQKCMRLEIRDTELPDGEDMHSSAFLRFDTIPHCDGRCRARVVVRLTDDKTTRVMTIYTVHIFTKIYWKKNITKTSIHVTTRLYPSNTSLHLPGGHLLPLSLPTSPLANQQTSLATQSSA